MLLPGSVVREGARVLRSIVGSRATVGAGASLVGSVLGDGAGASPGAQLDGVRMSSGQRSLRASGTVAQPVGSRHRCV